MPRIHIGRKAPKGYRELPGGIHLGRGIWMLKIERTAETAGDRVAPGQPNEVASASPAVAAAFDEAKP